MNPSNEGYLYGAVRQNDLKRAERLLYEGKADPNKMPKILIHACAEGYLEMVELLITNPSNPANVNLDSEWVYQGTTVITRPVWVAVQAECLELLQLLLRKALVKMDLECTRTFVEEDVACPERKEFSHEYTPLWQTVFHVENESVLSIQEELIKAGANIDAKRTLLADGQTLTDSLITYAVDENRMGLCRRLVRHGCDLRATRESPLWAKTALQLAVTRENPELVDFLLRHIPADNAELLLGLAMFEAIDNTYDQKYIEALFQLGGYKMRKRWRKSSKMNDKPFDHDELMLGIRLNAEDSCLTLLQYGWTPKEHFHLAVKKGMVRLMFQMVQRNPRVLLQSWLDDPQEFGELPQHAVNWLYKVRRQPILLKGICKGRLLRSLPLYPTSI